MKQTALDKFSASLNTLYICTNKKQWLTKLNLIIYTYPISVKSFN